MEVADYLYSNIDKNDKLKEQLNKYFKIRNNNEYSLDTKIEPLKNISEFKYLPFLIGDNNYKHFNSNHKDINNKFYLISEGFIQNYIKSYFDLEIFYKEVLEFKILLENEEILKHNFNHYRKLFRLNTIKLLTKNGESNKTTMFPKHHLINNNFIGYFKYNDSNSAKFYDVIIYLFIDYNDVINITKFIINHIEKFYLI